MDDSVRSAGIIGEDATRESLTDGDNEILLRLSPRDEPVTRTLSAGSYHLVAAPASAAGTTPSAASATASAPAEGASPAAQAAAPSS